MNAVLAAITAACNAYISWVKLTLSNKIDEIEDEMDSLAADGSPYSKLRLERLAIRRKREQERAL